MRFLVVVLVWLVPTLAGLPAETESPLGYYRQPALHDDTLLFVAEGDLWKVPLAGGVAARLTSHPGDEGQAAVSPDGTTVAFVAQYEGPRELYTMPLAGGLPTRRTYGAGGVSVSGWTDDGRLIYSTPEYSTLPGWQLILLDLSSPGVGSTERIPLAQAADGTFDDAKTLYFTRLRFQGSQTKRYKGGTAQQIWRYGDGAVEAEPLTQDYPGTSKRPMFWNGRVYFATDRDGTMNLWSMTPDGSDLTQHTQHKGWDVASPSQSNGTIVYQLGADLRAYDIAANTDRPIDIRLDSDLDQMRERWVDDPMEYITAFHLSADGGRVALTARGRVFVAPHRQGRFVEATRKEGVRYRQARFMPDGKSLIALSDESGEVELWTLPANGVGAEDQLTRGGKVLRWQAVPSPHGLSIAHHDKDQRLYVYDVEKKKDHLIDENPTGGFSDLSWSPDGKWLAYVAPAPNLFSRIKIYGLESGETHVVTSDRFDSYDPVWGPDGDWIYFLSDRDLTSIVGSPWGNYQPEPYLDKTTRIYQLALREGLRSPFAAPNELEDRKEAELEEKKKDRDGDKDSEDPEDSDEAGEDDGQSETTTVVVEFDGIESRILPVPIERGNYSSLSANDQALFWIRRTTGGPDRELVGAKITREPVEIETLADKVNGYELAADGKKLLFRKDDTLYIIDAKPKKAELAKKNLDLSSWRLSLIPRDEWRQMFEEAWRLERDYFYAPNMHGVDWKAMREKYRQLVNRVTTRAELSDLIAQMVGELSALHTFVAGGDLRRGEDQIAPASLGALLIREDEAGGYRVSHIYRADPDEPELAGPLARPGVDVSEGDVIEFVNGSAVLDAPHIGSLLRHQAGRQVLLGVKANGDAESREVVVEPITLREGANLRYHEWEYTRRLEVEQEGDGRIGYLHLRAMGGRNYTEWAKGYYPVFDREGLIIDVRRNRGGNIDSWIISRLLRKAWFHWSQRAGHANSWNMQYAFRGHVVVLCDERTASDGEAFAEGFKRLGLGTVIGTRTWGGEIWLTGSNLLVDRGVATAAEFGVYGPDGDWLIEGHGVEPDIVVDNLPHETFDGRDAQLEAAIELLRKRIAEEPIAPWNPPTHPDKSFDN